MKNKLDYHAKLIVHGLPTMKQKDFDRFIAWLQQSIKNFKQEYKEDPKMYNELFRAKLMK